MNNKNNIYEIKSPKITNDLDLDLFMQQLKYCGFGAGRISRAVDILYEMVKDKNTNIFFGLAGAMVPAGMRSIITDMMREGYINVLVTTGANMVHDIIESLGLHHYLYSNIKNDIELYNQNINRIYDVYLPDSNFSVLETFLQNAIDKMNKKEPISIRHFMRCIGEQIKDKNSILRTAFDLNIPIFCPAFPDSVIGLQSFLYKELNPLIIDAIGDMHEFIDICWSSKKAGSFFVGGGVPKNYIFQSMLITPKKFDYAIQLTMDSPETGGLSGATLDEAISWGKVEKNAKYVTVYSDATITLPLIYASVKSRVYKKKI